MGKQQQHRFKEGQNREQLLLLPPSMDELVSQDSIARLIEVFVNDLDLNKLGYKAQTKSTGAMPFHPKDMLKLYLYGYINRIRSSRKLETECQRNIEVIWLLRNLRPKFRAIAYFRAHNANALKNTFRVLVQACKSLNLLNTNIIGIDGSRFRAVNSTKNNFTEKKLDKHLEYIDKKIDEYFQELDQNDRKEKGGDRLISPKAIRHLKDLNKRRIKYEGLKKLLKESCQEQISTTDADARSLMGSSKMPEVSYNVQTATDNQNKLVVHFEATNQNDRNALHKAATGAKEAIQKEEVTVLADKGYHNSQEIAACHQDNITTIVPPSKTGHSSAIPTADYQVEKFTYDQETDTYQCPEKQTLTTNGNWYQRSRKVGNVKVKHYKTSACGKCPANIFCTVQLNGRVIERSEHQEAIDKNNQLVIKEKELYKTRQEIIEHVFGTLKRGWGYSHTLVKGLEKVNGEFALIFTAYNLRRLVTIFGIKELIKLLKTLFSTHFWPILRTPSQEAGKQAGFQFFIQTLFSSITSPEKKFFPKIGEGKALILGFCTV